MLVLTNFIVKELEMMCGGKGLCRKVSSLLYIKHFSIEINNIAINKDIFYLYIKHLALLYNGNKVFGIYTLP